MVGRLLITSRVRMAWYKWWLRRTPLKEKPKQVFFHGIVKRLAQQRYIELYENLAAYVSLSALSSTLHTRNPQNGPNT
jgi:hypothetical protein